MSFRIQYASNLFVDRHFMPFQQLIRRPSISVPYLALLGNIGQPQHPRTIDFLRYCSAHYKQVFWVPAHHELSSHYSLTDNADFTHQIDAAMKLTRRIPNINFTYQNEYLVKERDIVVVGTPLWPSIENYHGHVSTVPEFQNIFKSQKDKIDDSTIQHWNFEDSDFLKMHLKFHRNFSKNTKVVVLTHMLPSPWLLSRGLSAQTYKNASLFILDKPANSGLLRPPVGLWLAGATGSCAHANVDGIPCAVNGLFEYEDEHCESPNKGFCATLFAEIKTTPPTKFFPPTVLRPLLTAPYRPLLA